MISNSNKEALQKAMALCARSEKCRYEVEEKLLQWGVSATDAEKIINELVTEKFIDEKRYASFYTRDKFRLNQWGKVKITYMLRSKKIPSEIIDHAVSEIDHDSYLDTLKKLLLTKSRTTRFVNEYEKKAKLTRYALEKGFEYGSIEQALDDL